MSNNERTKDSIGARLREERLYQGLSQDAFAKKLGVHRRSQGNYESGAREPDAAYLEAAFRSGVDVVYVLTGERTDYWHRALIHIVDLVLDELDLTSRDSEFRELWKRGYEAHLARVRGGDHKPGEEADQALLVFLRQSPRVLDNRVLSSVIEHLEFVAETKGLHLTHEAKAQAILRLYRESKAQGSGPSLKNIMAALEP